MKNISQKGLEFLGKMDAPIAGQSLTDNPDLVYKWQQPPEFTDLPTAIDGMFIKLTEPEALSSITDMASRGTPIADITKVILYAGFEEGMFNPDLMTLMIEPTMYMIMGLAEKAGVLDYKIYREEDEEPSDGEEQLKGLQNIIETAKETLVPDAFKNKASQVLSKEILNKIEEVKPESLLSKPETTEEE
jgi:hypothetical protein